ncbi:hypothetical protein QBD00_001525 [Ochrobactrum sp. AN78]|jgi:hypothetical protein|nr:hypothetical protein [Ochrobactrum sp. AN78]
MLRDIYRLVIVDCLVSEPFSAQSLAPYLPRVDEKRIAAYLRLNASKSSHNRHAFFIRYYRGWYRLNYLRLEDIEAAGK